MSQAISFLALLEHIEADLTLCTVGPSPAVLVNIGARFVPCMKSVEALPLSYAVTCFNTTTSSVSAADACTIAEWCGLALTDKPSQTWRFITPIVRPLSLLPPYPR